MSLVAIAVFLVMTIIVLIRMGRISWSNTAIGRCVMRAIVLLCGLNTLGNLAAEDRCET